MIKNKDLKSLLAESRVYRSLFAQYPDAVYVMDEQARFVDCNPAMEALTGFARGEILTMCCPSLVPVEDLDKVMQYFQKAMQGEAQKFQCTFFHKHKHKVNLEVQLKPVIDDHQVMGVYGIARHSSQTEKLAVAGELAAGIAHEIRNPLTAVKGFFQLIQSDTGRQQRYFDIIFDELKRIEWVMTQLLVLARPQAVDYQRRDVREMMKDVVMLSRSQAVLKRVKFSLEFEEEAPVIYCAENQMKQVFYNFIENSLDAMPDGGTIEIQIKRSGRDTVEIRITDTGCGIPEEIMARLGEPFYTTKEKGTGLGLMVSHKIIQEHRGTVQYKSRLGCGTMVCVRLPAEEAT